MTGMSEQSYRDMMINGGRSIEGNRYIGESGDAQTADDQDKPNKEDNN